jgi:2-dehydro-3-deoxyphosphogluconate aldolase/(4S)-4-hydroxy-2-oxoglutarate aldolase
MTPSEVMIATDLGADVVKVFPASLGGPRLIADLRGPFPDVPLVPSGGVIAENAQDFLDAGAPAVCAGTGVVPPAAVAAGSWGLVEEAARRFCGRLRPGAPGSTT